MPGLVLRNLPGELTPHPLKWLNCTVLSDRIPYYILDLLQLTPSVQVEGLGRFEAIFHSAKTDDRQSTMMPPHVEGAFSPDDTAPGELLESFIHYTSGNLPESPKKAIADFVKSVRKGTDEGEAFVIDTFGTFVKSSSGHLRFTPDWDAFNIAFKGLESVALKTDQSESPVVVPLTPPEPYVPKPIEFIDETTEGDAADEAAAAASLAAVEQSKVEFEKNLDRADPSNSRTWWLLLMTAIVLIAILCVYLTWDIMHNRSRLNELRQAYADTTEIAPPANVPPETSEEDPVQVPEENQVNDTKEPEAPVLSTDNASKCYIIVGAFGDPANVSKMVARLEHMQYTVKQIEGRTLTKVGVETVCDQAELQRTLNALRSSVNPESWIY